MLQQSNSNNHPAMVKSEVTSHTSKHVLTLQVPAKVSQFPSLY